MEEEEDPPAVVAVVAAEAAGNLYQATSPPAVTGGVTPGQDGSKKSLLRPAHVEKAPHAIKNRTVLYGRLAVILLLALVKLTVGLKTLTWFLAGGNSFFSKLVCVGFCKELRVRIQHTLKGALT